MEGVVFLEPENKNQKMKMWIIIILSVVIVSSIVGYVVYFWQKNKTELAEDKYLSEKMINESLNDGTVNNDGYDLSEPDEYNGDNQPEELNYVKLDKVYVDWEKEPIETKEGCSEENIKCLLVGKIINDGPYKGTNLYLRLDYGLGTIFSHYVFRQFGNGEPSLEYIRKKEGDTPGTIIVGIDDIPEEISLPGTSYKLKKYYSPTNLFSDMKIEKKYFSNETLGDMFLSEGGCLVARLPDGTAIGYSIDTSFIDKERRVPDFRFDKGGSNADEYDYLVHSCANDCVRLSQPSEFFNQNDLEVVGKTSNGDDVYGYKDQKHKALQSLYEDRGTIAYYSEGYQQVDKSKYSYDEFVKMRPYLFWKDPLGRWVEFRNSKLSVAAEMCKPVLYLYPQKKSLVNIKIDIRGFLTHTDPLYRDGWRVEAYPDGRMKDLDTGKYYDSLLWEGVGLEYPKQEQGWVVKRDELEKFFDDKLESLGLNEKEAGEFKEYWLARLVDKEFYKISFLTRNQFDGLATLEFGPGKPDTFIRVMMTAKGLDRFEDIPEQKFSKTPLRNGFTAVEWGGALLK